MMNKYIFPLFASFLSCVLCIEINTYSLLMPNVYPHRDELYLCTPIRIAPNSDYYVVGFKPNASMHTAHHMLIYGCAEVGANEQVWNCGEMQNDDIDEYYKTASPCAAGSQIVYAWALDAPSLKLPDGVGFHIGRNSHIKYLVLQVHYMHKFKEGKTDNSGVFLRYTSVKMPREAGVILLGTGGTIPPLKTERMETACTIMEDKVIHPFAFRTHTHSLGQIVAGYVVHQNPAGDEWEMLGKKSPKLPQMFYPTISQKPIRKGDVLAARCIMKNPHDYPVEIGSTNRDEMCNFYLMYWVEHDKPLGQKYCFTPGPPMFYWSNAHQGFNRVPHPEAN